MIIRNANFQSYIRFDVFTAVTMNNSVSAMLSRVALVRTDVSEELSASIIMVTGLGELGTTFYCFVACVSS
jgi:hypothetical protein